ncbi:cytochrome C oxidase subunit II [Vibrio sinaloensis]|uniref:TorD/DmsD family molecular chaperone n=1 Tax=Photobacterium sp. (strain ATCC 43367) TaxID=379097 RepID=UPI00057DE621|nr:molecular chaperone TorD family protein [Vibrio sinaloensis]KIE20612.1 cytochrome C oxidase subunit II [Vibrio sinaloensis]
MSIEQQTLRTEIYLLLSALLRHTPSTEMLAFLSQLEAESEQSEMQKAWQGISTAAAKANISELEDEYQELFIGIGRGEVVPFASWHRTGSLMEKPLAEIRNDLDQMGFEREEQVKEPEDHIAALCEVMAMITQEDEALQQAFFNKHIAPWFGSLVNQISEAKSADFYLNVAALLNAFLSLEQVRFSEKTKSSKTQLKIDVKNVTEYDQAQQ